MDTCPNQSTTVVPVSAGHKRCAGSTIWAKLVEARLSHLPYASHPILQLLRGISHLHSRLLSTPLPGVLVYVMIHVHMLCIYVGKTTLALLQRLRKHGTTRMLAQRMPLFTKCCGVPDLPDGPPSYCSLPMMRYRPVFFGM